MQQDPKDLVVIELGEFLFVVPKGKPPTWDDIAGNLEYRLAQAAERWRASIKVDGWEEAKGATWLESYELAFLPEKPGQIAHYIMGLDWVYLSLRNLERSLERHLALPPGERDYGHDPASVLEGQEEEELGSLIQSLKAMSY